MDKRPNAKRIVLVAMVDSIHVARWVRQFSTESYQFWIFPSTPNRQVHPQLASQPNVRIHGWGGRLSLFTWAIDFMVGGKFRPILLARFIGKASPSYIHALEFQHGAYLAESALRKTESSPPFIVTNYGSDIYWFKRFPNHAKRIADVLARADRYSAECARDIILAREMGFAGEVLPVIPNAGGILVDPSLVLENHERKTIAIKGYDGWVGRALNVVSSLKLIEDDLKNVEIVFYSCNRRTLRAVNKLQESTTLSVKAYKKKALTHERMLQLFGQSLIYVGVSLSDGISTSMTEAIALGAFPIQTNTACTKEWFNDNESGLEIKDIAPSAIAETIKKGLKLARDPNANSLYAANRERVIRKLSPELIAAQAMRFYE